MNLRRRREDPPEINLTALIDVVFLLLIFFMVSTTFNDESGIQLALPEADGEPAADEPRVLEIVIDRQGTFYVGGSQVVDTTLATLKKAIAGAAGADRDQPVVIKADAQTPHQAVITAMDAASQLGLVRFSFATTRPRPEGAR